MKTVLSALISASVLFTTSVASVAEPNKTVTIDEVVSLHCAAEWAKFEVENPWPSFDLIEVLFEIEDLFEIDLTTLDAATTDAFNRYIAASVALFDYFVAFNEFSEETNQTPEYSDVARAKFDLTMCLLPTDAERDLIVDMFRTITGGSDDDFRKAWFRDFDRFECMQFAKASEAIFSVESFPFDYNAIREANMKTCN